MLIIRDGYRIPSVSLLEPYFFRNRSSSFNHSEFVQEAIDERLIRDSITQLDLAPAFCNPLHVAVQGDGKHRLILDLFFLNKFIWKQSLKYEGVRTVLTMFDWDFYFFTFDLKSGYHHVEILPRHRVSYLFSPILFLIILEREQACNFYNFYNTVIISFSFYYIIFNFVN